MFVEQKVQFFELDLQTYGFGRHEDVPDGWARRRTINLDDHFWAGMGVSGAIESIKSTGVERSVVWLINIEMFIFIGHDTLNTTFVITYYCVI